MLVNKMGTVFKREVEISYYDLLKMTLQCVALGSNQDYSMEVILKDLISEKERK